MKIGACRPVLVIVWETLHNMGENSLTFAFSTLDRLPTIWLKKVPGQTFATGKVSTMAMQAFAWFVSFQAVACGCH